MLSVDIKGKTYTVDDPIDCSRPIITATKSMSQAFSLPQVEYEPVTAGGFIGDVTQGGSCNVRLIRFTPHNLTHLETPNHIESEGLTVDKLPTSTFSGLSYVVDLSDEDLTDGYIHPHHLEVVETLEINKNISCLIIKTNISKLPVDHDFSNTDPICLHPSTGKFVSDTLPQVRLLVLDLPSADKEEDGGLLAAHRNFFQLEKSKTGSAKAIIELAHFPKTITSGVYYLVATPPRIDLDAIITGLLLYPIDY